MSISSQQRWRCLFCGALASDMRLIQQPRGLMCVECFVQIGEMFAEAGDDVPTFVHSETCALCRNSARRRFLVAGVGAAICLPCYAGIQKAKRPSAEIDPFTYPLRGSRLRALQRSRAARLRARGKIQQSSQAFRTLPREDRRTRGIRLLTDKALAQVELGRHLDLVTSRERVPGRGVLKFPDGRRRIYPFSDRPRRKAGRTSAVVPLIPSEPTRGR